jgi:hypothetical protein
LKVRHECSNKDGLGNEGSGVCVPSGLKIRILAFEFFIGNIEFSIDDKYYDGSVEILAKKCQPHLLTGLL